MLFIDMFVPDIHQLSIKHYVYQSWSLFIHDVAVNALHVGKYPHQQIHKKSSKGKRQQM